MRRVFQLRVECRKLSIMNAQHQRPPVTRAARLRMRCDMGALRNKSQQLLGRCMHTYYRRAVPCCSSCVTHVQWLNAYLHA